MDSSTVEAVIAASRRAGFINDPSGTLANLDAALAGTTDPGHRGHLLLARALAQQGLADTGPAAADAQSSVVHLLEAGDRSAAAFATACAAGMTHRAGNTAAALDLAVDALVLMSDDDLTDEHLIRAANAMAVLFIRLSAFDLARSSARRAFDGAMQYDDHNARSITAFTLGRCATAAIRTATLDTTSRAEFVSDLDDAVAWLVSPSAGPIERAVIGSGMRAERLLIDFITDEPDSVRTTVATDRNELEVVCTFLERSVSLYPETSPRLGAWHRLVRACVHRQLGDAEKAEALLDEAIPELLRGGDEHRVVLAFHERSAARAASMDLLGALEDAKEVARLSRQWQQLHVGRLAMQIAQRAELERATSVLSRRADELTKQAEEDPVTGLGTRRSLEMRMDQLATHNHDGAVIVLDLDSFKQVNDSYGHQTGDVVLARVGLALRSVVRDGTAVARFGGEEFVVLLPDATKTEAVEVAERIRGSLHAVDWDEVAVGLRVTVSAGVAAGPMSGVRELLRMADTALFEAKRAGRDCVIAR